MINKFLKKYIYLQKKCKKLLEIWHLYNSILLEYQKTVSVLDNTPNQPSKFKTKSWIEKNDGSYGVHNTGSPIKFKTSMLRSSLCNSRDA